MIFIYFRSDTSPSRARRLRTVAQYLHQRSLRYASISCTLGSRPLSTVLRARRSAAAVASVSIVYCHLPKSKTYRCRTRCAQSRSSSVPSCSASAALLASGPHIQRNRVGYRHMHARATATRLWRIASSVIPKNIGPMIQGIPQCYKINSQAGKTVP